MASGIVIGMGEVGSALYQVLSEVHSVSAYDSKYKEPESWPQVDVLHVTFPCDDPIKFRDQVRHYQSLCSPSYTVIHSTTYVGVTRSIGPSCYHSPVRGVHPHLARSLSEFVTYLAPEPDDFLLSYFTSAGFRIHPVSKPEETEAGKLWDLAAYAISILLEKEIHRYCERAGLDFNTVYKHWTHSYNEGFSKLGMDHVTRPILNHIPGPIGGHCVIPAMEKLGLYLGGQVILHDDPSPKDGR